MEKDLHCACSIAKYMMLKGRLDNMNVRIEVPILNSPFSIKEAQYYPRAPPPDSSP